MAGLYIILSKADSNRLNRVASYLRHSNESQEICGDDFFSFVWLAFDCRDRYSPAFDSQSGVRVVSAGQLVFPGELWQRAQRLPFAGGLANRLVLEKYLEGGEAAITPFNGAACVAIWDPRVAKLHLWTDQFGYHPVYQYQGSPDCIPTVLTTFPDALKADPLVNCELDVVSLAEFLRAWRVTPPHTYYKNLSHVGAATHLECELKSGKQHKRTYWKPFIQDFYKSLDDAAEDLSSALKSAVAERTSIAKKACFFVSGGSDSRVMLFGADDPSKIVSINIYETEPTYESKTAEALCKRAGSQFIGQSRDNDYYPRMLAENVRWSGAMWSAEDSHYLGFKSVVDKLDVDLVMTACTTDWIFKGYGLEKTWKKLFGRYLPLKEFLPERQDCFLPNMARPAPPALKEEIENRFEAWFTGCPKKLKSDIDYLQVEDRRIRPSCYTVSVSGQMMYRVFPYNTFLADSRVAQCYGKIPAWMKLNGQVWGKAAALVCKGAVDIVDSNFGWSVNANAFEKLVAFSRGWIGRRIARLRPKPQSTCTGGNHPACYASWPEYGWYATHSPTVEKLWNAVDESNKSLLATAWGSDPWQVERQQWALTPLDFFRLLTAVSFLTQQNST
jgi:hypothetical protein